MGVARAALMARNAIGLGPRAGGPTSGAAAINAMTTAQNRYNAAQGRTVRNLHQMRTAAIGIGTGTFIGMAALGVGAAAFRQRAGLEREAMIAGFAGGRDRAVIEKEAIARAREYNLRLLDSVRLSREIEQLGLRGEGAAEQSKAIGAAASQFNILNKEVASPDAAIAIFRLIKATSKSQEEFEHNLLAAERYASAIQLAGDRSAAGAGAVFEMTKELQPLAQVMNISSAEVVTLAAALADLNEEQRGMFRGSITRLGVKGVIDPNQPLPGLVAIGEKLRSMQDEGAKLDYLKAIGLSDIRDPITLATIAANLENISTLLPVIRGELEGTGQTSLFQRTQSVLLGLQGRFDGFITSMDIMGSKIIETLAPALITLMEGFKGIADTISSSKGLQALLGIGGALALGKFAKFLIGKQIFGPSVRAGAVAGAGGFGGNEAMNAALMASMFMPFGGTRAAGLKGMLSARFRMGQAGASAGSMFLGDLSKRQRFGAGLMGLIGGRTGANIAGRLASGAVGRLALGSTGVGLLVVAAGLLEKPAMNIARAFSEMGARGGVVGAIFSGLGFAFRVISVAGRGVNFVFDKMGDFFMLILNKLKPLGDFFNKGLQDLNRGFDNIFGGGSPSAAAPPSARGRSVTNTYNVNVASPSGVAAFFQSQSAQSAASYFGSTTSLVGSG